MLSKQEILVEAQAETSDQGHRNLNHVVANLVAFMEPNPAWNATRLPIDGEFLTTVTQESSPKKGNWFAALSSLGKFEDGGIVVSPVKNNVEFPGL
ncbi:unnamed protein product [Linum trigynum]|uniref:Uncharacterized protein n=1 Tax=Linum trigynum TaxID=586398 RepID=A0AAV2E4J4_9ROSI